MTQHYLPMLAAMADGPFSAGDWLFEIKWDGVRAIAYVSDTLSLISRNGRDLAGRFPELSELLEYAPKTVLDGEIVVMRKGVPDIQSLLPRLQSQGKPPAGSPPVTYIIFDILEKDGRPLTGLPLLTRREILKASVREGPHVVLSEPVDGNGEEYYRAAVSRGIEGVMAKRKDSLYEPGMRSGVWLKIRAERTCDCIIAGYTKGRMGRSPVFGALLLALYEDGTGSADNSEPVSGSGKHLVYTGKVGTGFRERDLSELRELFSGYRTETPTLPKITIEGPVVWLKPELVCEVAYQQVTREGKLRIPRFRRLRIDRKPEDCTIDQLATRTVPVPAGLSATAAPPVRSTPALARSASGYNVSGNGRSGRNFKTDDSLVEMKAYENLLRDQSTEQYREKRDFSKTPEPEGGAAVTGTTFVIQEHHAHHLHYDLRLERDGVLKSWAVPKGIPESPGAKHLAVAVEDHPLEYATFEGTIPAGEYGAGTVSIWDSGTYETKHWDDKKIEVVLHGKRLFGLYILVKFMRAGTSEWLVFKAAAG